jgi:hypothetical protein
MRLAAAIDRGAANDRRRYDRRQTNFGAGLSANLRRDEPVTIVDLSRGGCGIQSNYDFPPGARVWLKLPGIENWPCRVSWSENGRAGLVFDHPLHDGVVARFVG